MSTAKRLAAAKAALAVSEKDRSINSYDLRQKVRRLERRQENIEDAKFFAALATLVVIAIVLVLRVAFHHAWVRMWSWVHLTAPVWLSVLWPFILTLTAGLAWLVRSEKKSKWVRIVPLVALCAVMGTLMGFTGRMVNRSDFDALRHFAQNVETLDSVEVGYAPRIPSSIAEKKIDQLSNIQGVASKTEVNHTSVNGDPAWCAGGITGDSLGREPAQYVICVRDSDSKIFTAKFEVKIPTIDGNFSTSLDRALAPHGWLANAEDVYFWISNDEPYMAAVGTEAAGNPFVATRTQTAGVKVWDIAGNTEVYTEVSPGQFPFPVITFNEMRQVRHSLNTRAGFWCWNKGDLRTREKCLPMFETTSQVNGTAAAGDPNAGNASEFITTNSDGRLVAVTLLTPVGKARQVAAVLEVEVDSLKVGTPPSARVIDLQDQLASPGYVAEVVTGMFADSLTWVTEVDEDARTSAFRIFELTPISPTAYQGVIGTATATTYTFTVDAVFDEGDGTFGEVCVKSGVRPGEARCFNSASGPQGVNALAGLSADDPEDPQDPQVPPSDLADVPTSELVAELCRRTPGCEP